MTDILLGLRYQDPILELLMREIKNMIDLKELPSYQRLVAEGKEEGRTEGRMEGLTEGLLKGLRASIVRLGTKFLGKPTRATLRELNAITEERRLADIVERVVEAKTWRQLLAKK